MQVQSVRATLAAVADHCDRLTQAGWAVDFVVDLHALLLMTTGPERTTSWTPCLLNSSTKSPTSVPSPANSTVVPAGLLWTTFALPAIRPTQSAADLGASTDSPL